MAALLSITLLSNGHSQSAPAPLDVVRRFCQADGRGDRLHPRRWTAVAPLITWTVEPAWDRVVLIRGYQVQPPRLAGDHIEIDVEYTVAGAVSAAWVEKVPGREALTFALVGDDSSGWRISAPAPPPHVFVNQVEIEALRAWLDPQSTGYVSASAFVWRMLTDAGWSVPYHPVDKLRDPDAFVAVEDPKPGDLALFLADGVPYHVGLVTGENLIASATVNAGLMKTPLDAFAGTVLYLRLVEPRTPRATVPVVKSGAAGTRPTATPAVHRRRPSPTPRAGLRSTRQARPRSSKLQRAPASRPAARRATPARLVR